MNFCFFGVRAQYNDSTINGYIERYKHLAIHKMQEYKIPASITLAQGIFESGCGTSRLAKEGNNHFGIKCHAGWAGDSMLVDDDAKGECFRKYEKAEDSFNDHSLFLTTRSRYQKLFQLDITDYKSWARELKAAGYATNPKYADRLIALIEKYNIARYDTLAMNGELLVETSSRHNLQDRLNADLKMIHEMETCYFSEKEVEFKQVHFPFSEREVFENNRTYLVIAREGDTYKQIAKDVQDIEKHLRKFNDAGKNDEPKTGEIVYIEKKSRTNPVGKYKVQNGDNLRCIAQRCAVRLSSLLRYNSLNNSSVVRQGDELKLK
ncbi:MAG: glucosaminidase domain-containing protein [Bacteroidales bacterium]|nr:glucosaminidase domain-containing protein [Bacteroidales bacterium]